MSFVITVYVPEAIVLAADSRMFLSVAPAAGTPIETPISDSNTKLFLLSKEDKESGQRSRPAGVTTFGDAILHGRTIESHVKQFSYKCLEVADDVLSIKDKLLPYFRDISPTANLGFQVAGFRTENKAEVERVWVLGVAGNFSTRVNVLPGASATVFGANWGGAADVIARLANCTQVQQGGQALNFKPIPVLWEVMTVQDAVDYAQYAVRTTIDTMRFEARQKTVGGPIDCVLITPEAAQWIQQKRIRGETLP